MDPLLAALLAVLRREAVKIGSDLIDRGLDIVGARLAGEPTDDAVLAWLAEAQDAP